jgi:hypothetical protein
MNARIIHASLASGSQIIQINVPVSKDNEEERNVETSRSFMFSAVIPKQRQV